MDLTISKVFLFKSKEIVKKIPTAQRGANQQGAEKRGQIKFY
jgi:hypothetical protein